MTFNIAHGRGLSLYQGFHTSRGIRKNLDRIANVITKYQPDVIALQEVDESSHWNKHINLLDYLQSATGYGYSAHGVHNKRSGRKPLAYGNAFLSKRPILESHTEAFGDKPLGEKGFMEIHVDFGDNVVEFINIHLDFRSRKERIQQVEKIIEKFESKSFTRKGMLPPIICGDFNTSSRHIRDALHQFVKKSAKHAHYEYFPKKELTFPTHFPSRGLDFILLAKPFATKQVKVARCYASDHLPVIMEFTIDSTLSHHIARETHAALI